MDPRYFLSSLSLGVSVLCFPDRFLLKAERHLKRHYALILKTYQRAKQNQYIREGGILCWGNLFEVPKDIPIFREFLTDYPGISSHDVELDYTPAELNKEKSLQQFMDAYWSQNKSPGASAFYHLQSLDIGALSYGEDHEPVGEIEFLDKIFRGNDSLLAAISVDLSLTCLQHTLLTIITKFIRPNII